MSAAFCLNCAVTRYTISRCAADLGQATTDTSSQQAGLPTIDGGPLPTTDSVGRSEGGADVSGPAATAAAAPVASDTYAVVGGDSSRYDGADSGSRGGVERYRDPNMDLMAGAAGATEGSSPEGDQMPGYTDPRVKPGQPGYQTELLDGGDSMGVPPQVRAIGGAGYEAGAASGASAVPTGATGTGADGLLPPVATKGGESGYQADSGSFRQPEYGAAGAMPVATESGTGDRGLGGVGGTRSR